MASAPSQGHVWAVEHQDFDLITAMPPATADGLEVLLDGDWQPATPPDGYAIVLAGMALERLTSGLLPAPGAHHGHP
jgi:isopenicillin N synthase-like dioxygenase